MTEDQNIEKPLRIIGTPVRDNGKYVLREHGLLNIECGWICPKCNEPVAIRPTSTGLQTFRCGTCNAKFVVEIKQPQIGEPITFTPKKAVKPAHKPAQQGDGQTPSQPPVPPAVPPLNGGQQSGCNGVVLSGGPVADKADAAPQQQAEQQKTGDVPPQTPPVNPYGHADEPQRRQDEPQRRADEPQRRADEPQRRADEPQHRADEPQRQPEQTYGETVRQQEPVVPPPPPPIPCGPQPAGMLQWADAYGPRMANVYEGTVIIGRDDPTAPSDIAIADPEVSRRSLQLATTRNPYGGYEFMLTVLKSLNQVIVNNYLVPPGYCIQLVPNSTIVVGHTAMTFVVY